METKKYRTCEITFSDEELKERLMPNCNGRIKGIVPSLKGGWDVIFIEED